MRLNRALRMLRWAPLAVVAVAAACKHGDLNSVVTLNGDTVIRNVSLIAPATGTAAGSPLGTRVVNRFKVSNFDTTKADAFTRSSATAANLRASPGEACYGSTPLIQFTSVAATPYTPPNRFLPAITSTTSATTFARATTTSCGPAVAYIVQPGHPGNGGTFWEVWSRLNQLKTNTRYVMGFVRYALQVRGALDHNQLLLGDPVTQPDTLVFRAGDFNPSGRKANASFIGDCADPAELQPTAGANPHLLGGGTADATGLRDFDQTVCGDAASIWSSLGTAKSPVPPNNNTALGPNQYNFEVIWEALADSTPNYARPVYRQQIGPLLTTTGTVINNGYAPVPAAALTPTQVFASAGGTAAFLAPDSVSVTISNLAPLAAGSRYEVWLTQTGTANARSLTGRLDHIVGGVIVDSNLTATNFDGDTRAGVTTKLTFDFANYVALGNWNSVVVAIGTGSGGTALPAVQSMWSTGVGKVLQGQTAPSASQSLTFGQFDNAGANLRAWGPNGNGTGGVFGFNLDITVNHLPRPPVGYYYNAFMRNSADTTVAPRDLGPVTSVWPDYASLIDADVTTGGEVNDYEIVKATVRVEGSSATEFCSWDRIEVRLVPKSVLTTQPTRNSGLAPTITVAGTNPWFTATRCTTP